MTQPVARAAATQGTVSTASRSFQTSAQLSQPSIASRRRWAWWEQFCHGSIEGTPQEFSSHRITPWENVVKVEQRLTYLLSLSSLQMNTRCLCKICHWISTLHAPSWQPSSSDFILLAGCWWKWSRVILRLNYFSTVTYIAKKEKRRRRKRKHVVITKRLREKKNFELPAPW